MIHLLILVQRLKDKLLDGTNRPENSPRAIVDFECVSLRLLNVSKTIVFESKADYFDVTVVEKKVVTIVFGLVRSDCDRIFVGSKHQEIAS